MQTIVTLLMILGYLFVGAMAASWYSIRAAKPSRLLYWSVFVLTPLALKALLTI